MLICYLEKRDEQKIQYQFLCNKTINYKCYMSSIYFDNFCLRKFYSLLRLKHGSVISACTQTGPFKTTVSSGNDSKTSTCFQKSCLSKNSDTDFNSKSEIIAISNSHVITWLINYWLRFNLEQSEGSHPKWTKTDLPTSHHRLKSAICFLKWEFFGNIST